MAMQRRDFLKGTAWMGAAALAAGCRAGRFSLTDGGAMATYADKPMAKVRVGIVGLGRGWAGVSGFATIPGNEIVAICDLNEARINAVLKYLEEKKLPKPRVYSGPEGWKRLCDSDDIDLVYNATPWQLHVPIALYAMRAGKHVATEVPSAFTVDECWELVETSEKLRRHCMQLENCCYGENEMLALNLCRLGLLGELVHGEGAYIHDLRSYNYADWNEKKGGGGYWDFWRLRHNVRHAGNQYPTHGLGPICWYMDVNRGDRFDYLVSVDSKQANFETYADAAFKDAKDAWKRDLEVKMGDMNTTVIKTVRGRTIMVQHDVSSPRPYSRLNLISGTKGILADYPLRVGFTDKPGERVGFFDDKKLEEVRQKYMHPLWKTAGEIAKKIGGHGGMDFLMVLRLSYCLQNGLPLDENVYDLASWCSLCELTERSATHEGRSMKVPDFTCGGWKTTPPLGDLDVDLKKIGEFK